MILFGVLIVVLAALAYVRLAPVDVARWHVPLEAEADRDFAGGVIRVVQTQADALVLIDAAARDLPRTHVLAGSVAEGHITYVTRSKWFGFPDYTTVAHTDDTVKIYARLRFGSSDLGVNGARVRQLLSVLPPA